MVTISSSFALSGLHVFFADPSAVGGYPFEDPTYLASIVPDIIYVKAGEAVNPLFTDSFKYVSLETDKQDYDMYVKPVWADDYGASDDRDFRFSLGDGVASLVNVYSYDTIIRIPAYVQTNSGYGPVYKVTELYYADSGNSYSVFENNQSLESVVIPHTITGIGYNAFNGCSALTSIEIPSSVTSIGEQSFAGTGLTSIKIPSSVVYIGTNPFGDSGKLASIIVEEGNDVYDSRDNCNAIIETNTNVLIAGCNTTKIPATVIRIGERAFTCGGLTSITIPSSVQSIGNWAVTWSGVTTVVIESESVAGDGNSLYNLLSSHETKTVYVKNKGDGNPMEVDSVLTDDLEFTMADTSDKTGYTKYTR